MSNKLKPILYPAPFLTKKLQSKFPDGRQASHYSLAKYFPKFSQRLEIPSKPNWRILQKIKQIKTIHHLKAENYSMIQKKFVQRLRRLLQNKRKTMQSIPLINGWQSLELGMFLPKLQILNLSSKWQSGWLKRKSKLKDPESKIWRFYKRFWIACRHLEHVKMFEFDHDLPLLIQELNKQNKILSYLKTFDLELETINDENSLLEIKEKFEKLFPSLSPFMDLKEESFTSFAPLIISLLLSYSKASRINVQIGNNRNTREYVNILKNGDTLTLKVWDVGIFLNQNVFSKSLQKMSQAISHYGRVSRCSRPIQRRALEFQFYNISEKNSFNRDFLPSLLKEALDIESLVLKFSFNPNRKSHFHLLPTLEALSDFKSLKHLTILDQSENNRKKLSLNLQDAPEKVLPLSQLTSFNIDCHVLEAPPFKDFFQLFLADEQGHKNISCSKISLSSVQSLTEFFKSLNNYRGITEQQAASFKVHLRFNHIEDVLRDFESCLSLRKKIPIDLRIDARAASIIPVDLSQNITRLLQITFPQFKVTNDFPSDIFFLKI